MQGQVGRLLNRLKRLADTSIDLEDFKLALEEVMEDHNYAVEKEQTQADYVAAGAAGGGLGAVLGEIAANAYKEKYRKIKRPLTRKGLLIAAGSGAMGGGLGSLIGYRLKKRREARLNEDSE